MITLEEIQQKQSELQSMIAKFKAQQQKEPCPLEEGREVKVSGVKVGETLLNFTDISVTGEGYGAIITLKAQWHRDQALKKARAIITEFGGATD